MRMEDKSLAQFRDVRQKGLLGGGKERIDKQHQKGKYTARERIEKLLDPETFEEVGMLAETIAVEFGMDKNRSPGDGVVTGYGKINGKSVSIIASDATVMGGSGQSTHVKKLVESISGAGKYLIPLVQLMDSSGGRVQEGFGYISFAGSVFYSHTLASGVIPQITAILGRCAGGIVYGAALTDFIIIVDKIGEMYITGPRVIKEVSGEDISLEELGGASVHCQISGCADFRVQTEEECFELIKKLMSFLPSNYLERPPKMQVGSSIDRMGKTIGSVVPSDPKKAYDMKEVILRIVDNGDFLEVKREFAKNAVVGFARLNGASVGIVANQPNVYAGSITGDSSEKCARFIRFCDAFNMPIISFIDTPGYLPGVKEERLGIIRRGAKLLYAYCEASVPKISVVMRKGYGGALFAMGGIKEHGTDLVLAWPFAEFAVMGAEEAVELLYKDQLASSVNRDELKQRLAKEYRDEVANPYYVARRMVIHDVIEPEETRNKLIHYLEVFARKMQHQVARRHGNIPL
jgi:methylmalonyl-CoA decarboxylase subunit alpha